MNLRILLFLLSSVFATGAAAQNPPPSDYKGPVMPPRDAIIKPPGTISGGVLNGKAKSLPKPVYPKDALTARVQGPVTVQVLIDEEGKVLQAVAVNGEPMLQDAAVTAAKGALFMPTMLKGEPVKVSGLITYNFVADNRTLKDRALYMGMTIEFMKANELEMLGRSPLDTIRAFVSNVPTELATEKPLFEELGAAGDTERPIAASNLIDNIKPRMGAEERWRFEMGGYGAGLMLEMRRVAKEKARPEFDFDPSRLNELLRAMKNLLEAAPAGLSPELIAKFENVASFADDPQLGNSKRVGNLWVALNTAMR